MRKIEIIHGKAAPCPYWAYLSFQHKVQEYIAVIILVTVMPNNKRRSIQKVGIFSIYIVQLSDGNSEVIVIETPLMGEDGLLYIVVFARLIIIHPHLWRDDDVIEVKVPIVGKRELELCPDVIEVRLTVGNSHIIGAWTPLYKSSTKRDEEVSTFTTPLNKTKARKRQINKIAYKWNIGR